MIEHNTEQNHKCTQNVIFPLTFFLSFYLLNHQNFSASSQQTYKTIKKNNPQKEDTTFRMGYKNLIKLEEIKHTPHLKQITCNLSKNIIEIFIFRCTVKHIPPNTTKLKLICKGNTYTSGEETVFESFSFWKIHNIKMNQNSYFRDI